MKELKKFKVRGYYFSQYFYNGKPQKYRGEQVSSRSQFDLTIYRENIAHVIFTLFEQYYRTYRFDDEDMINQLDLESLQIVEVK